MKYGLSPEVLIRIGEQGADMLEHSLSQFHEQSVLRDIRDIVIIDDGAFTGNQMSFNISASTKIFTKNFGFNQKPYNYHITHLTQN